MNGGQHGPDAGMEQPPESRRVSWIGLSPDPPPSSIVGPASGWTPVSPAAAAPSPAGTELSAGTMPESLQMFVCWQVLLGSHWSRVQGSPSSQSVSTAQQPAWLLLVQVPVLASQVSVVQGFESSQSPSVLQQPLTEECWHLLLEHLSVVQTFPSSQSVSTAQHPLFFWLEQAPVAVSQVSVVQGFLSSQLVGQAPGWPVGILVSQLSLEIGRASCRERV